MSQDLVSARSGLHQLEAALAHFPGRRISLGTVVDSLGPGAWGLSFLLFGAMALIPGIAPLFGLALCTAALGLLLGHQRPWLPGRMRNWSADRHSLASGLARLRRRLKPVESGLRARSPHFLSAPMLRLAGIAALSNGWLILLPIPFGNALPALAVLVMALGLIARDGLALLAGLLATAVALVFDAALIWAGYRAVAALLQHLV
jgi:hypothetical protein